jgi:RNA polymerase sigma factor (sigma-70 family)
MMSDGFHDLIVRARGGDREAMDQVLSILRPQLESLARLYADPSRPAQSTADLLQECCVRAWQKIGSFEGGEDDGETFAMFRAWMGQIVRRLGMNAHRDRSAGGRIPPSKVRPLNPAGEENPAPASTRTPSAYVGAGERAQRIREALDELPDALAADIVRMRFFDGLTIPQISERIGLSPVRVRERHRSAMRRLRRELAELL